MRKLRRVRVETLLDGNLWTAEGKMLGLMYEQAECRLRQSYPLLSYLYRHTVGQ